MVFFFFFFNDTATTEIYTLSLHDALPISPSFPGLPPASSPVQLWRCAGFIKPATSLAQETAKCPEPLCPTLVLPPLGRRLVHLLRGRYPPVLARTGSCATPLGLSPPSAWSLVRRVFAGRTQPLLPTGASRRYL